MKIPAEPLNRSRRFYELRTGLKDMRGEIPAWESYFTGKPVVVVPLVVDYETAKGMARVGELDELATKDVEIERLRAELAVVTRNNSPVHAAPVNTESVNSEQPVNTEIVHRTAAEKRKEYRKEWQRKRREAKK